MDLLYIAITLAFFGLTLGILKLCDLLGRTAMTALYWIGIVITLALLIYLIIAILLPEKFS